MKILLSAYACAPNCGSEEGIGWNWLVSLGKAGHRIWCVTTVRASHGAQAEIQRLGLNNISIVHVEVPEWVEKSYRCEAGVYLHYLVWQWRAYLKAKQLNSTLDFDLVHHVTYGSIQMGSEMWRLGKPLIFGPTGGGQSSPASFRNYFFQWWRSEQIRGIVSRLLLAFYPGTRRTMRHAHTVLTTNSETFEMAKNLGAKDVRLLLDTTIATELFPEAPPIRSPEGPLKLLWTGRLMARKALLPVLEALAQVPPDIDFHLTILGDGPMGHLLPQWIEDLELQDRIEWKGQVTWDIVREHYATSDLFLFCSLRDSFGSQLLEAMAYGLPIITLDHQGAAAFVPSAAAIKVPVLTPSLTIEGIANAVIELSGSAERRLAMGQAGFAFARTQTSTNKAQQVQAIYDSIPSASNTPTQPTKDSSVKRIVAMLTCHNRRALTLTCLNKLSNQKLPGGYSLEFVIVDDGSSDGTADAIQEAVPAATLINGDGSLYWCGGMRKAWKKAAESNPDYYLAVNDDTILEDNAVASLLDAIKDSPKPALAVGCIRAHGSEQTIYGGVHRHKGVMPPSGKPKHCDTCNANCLLIPREIYLKVGTFHHAYTHQFGDFDYGYQASRLGFNVLQTATHVGSCSENPTRNTWRDRTLPRAERLRLLETPKGLPWKEWWEYNWRNSGWKAPFRCVNPWLRILLNL